TAIPDGSVLYICHLQIATTATAGDKTLVNTGVVMSTPAGGAVPGATGVDGKNSVGGNGPPPTRTPAPGSSPAVPVNRGNALAGDVVSVTATLHSGNKLVAGDQNDISFSADAAIPGSANDPTVPDCEVNAAIHKEATAFNFQPPGCAGGSMCTAIRALVFSL